MTKKLITQITDLGFKKRRIETDLGMPLNSLSGMLNGKKDIPLKWSLKLSEYVEKHTFKKEEPKKEATPNPTPPKNQPKMEEKKADLSEKEKARIELMNELNNL